MPRRNANSGSRVYRGNENQAPIPFFPEDLGRPWISRDGTRRTRRGKRAGH